MVVCCWFQGLHYRVEIAEEKIENLASWLNDLLSVDYKKFLDASKTTFTPREASVLVGATLNLGDSADGSSSSSLGTPLEIGIPPSVKGKEIKLNLVALGPKEEGSHDALEWLEFDRSKSFY